MNEEFSKEELELINKIKSLREEIKPSQATFEKILSSLPNSQGNIKKSIVTNHDGFRYSFSMWKYAFLAILVVAALGFNFVFLKQGQINKTNETQVTQNQEVPNQPVTADNADSTLQQTDAAISQATDQMDQDLKSLDQAGSQQDDLNNL